MVDTYLKRHMEDKIAAASGMFGAVMITGPRQAGKTTMLRNVAPGTRYVSLDDPVMLAAAEGGNTFFSDSPPPVIVDEIQRAPSLFMNIKKVIDERKEKGLFYLSGSQQFEMMKGVSESLAGRVAVLTLLGLSLREMSGMPFKGPFLPSPEYLSGTAAHADADIIWNTIQRGCLPELFTDSGMDWQLYYSSYTSTYIERDVRSLLNIENELKFIRFMTALAARTGSLLNLSSISGDVGISVPTAERWLSVLRASNTVYLLEPYHTNITKRAVKTPKLYFLDTGLASYLTRWNNPDVLRSGAMAGQFFETFVFAEILKSYYNTGINRPPLYFYRDKEGREIDMIIENGGMLHPIEIKKHSDPSKEDIRSFGVLDKTGRRGNGAVICMYGEVISITDLDKAVPIWTI